MDNLENIGLEEIKEKAYEKMCFAVKGMGESLLDIDRDRDFTLSYMYIGQYLAYKEIYTMFEIDDRERMVRLAYQQDSFKKLYEIIKHRHKLYKKRFHIA